MSDVIRTSRAVLAHWDGLDDLPQPTDEQADRANYEEMKRRMDELRGAVEGAATCPCGNNDCTFRQCRIVRLPSGVISTADDTDLLRGCGLEPDHEGLLWSDDVAAAIRRLIANERTLPDEPRHTSEETP